MRKLTRGIALILALVMCFGVTAFAANTATDNNLAKITSIDGNATVEFATLNNDEGKILVSYTDSTKTVITAEGQYLILMVTGDGSVIDRDSDILYINQVMDKDDGAVDGTIQFEVYPAQLQSGTILITGTNITPTTGKLGLIAAIVKAKFLLGDVDKSGTVDVGDATMLLRYLAGLANSNDLSMEAANVDGSTFVDVGDATLLLRVLAGLASL